MSFSLLHFSHTSNTRIIPGIAFLKTKIPEIKEQGPTALPEHIIHIFLTLIITNTEFARERDEILQCFEPLKNNFKLSPLFHSSPDQIVNSQRDFTEGGTRQYYQQLQVVGKDLERSNRLSGIVLELGYTCLATEDLFNSVLNQYQEVTEKDIAHVIGVMAMNHTGLSENESAKHAFFSSLSPDLKKEADSKAPKSWNIDNFVNVIIKKVSTLKYVIILCDFSICELTRRYYFIHYFTASQSELEGSDAQSGISKLHALGSERTCSDHCHLQEGDTRCIPS